MNKLRLFRDLSGVPSIFLAKVLCVTVHTYMAFEQGKMTPSNDILKIISLLYDIDESIVRDEKSVINSETIQQLESLKLLSDEERTACLSKRLLGENIKPTSKHFRDKKNEIRKSLFNT